jgi:diguanylate cyclase (GGDEF)-like protein/PAS domain S-box-containing protein
MGMNIKNPRRSLKAVLLIPLAAVLAVFAAIHLYTYSQQDAEYTEEYVDGAFLAAQRNFGTSVRANTDKLAATLSVLSQDEGLKRAMLAGDQQALLRRAKPIFDNLRKEQGITHFYFMRPDRGILLRVHQPDRYGDVIDRFTAKQAQATGKQASGLELGSSGTFTLRTVTPWRDGDRLIGYLELGEEIGLLLDSIRDAHNLDFFVTINKSYLLRQDWAQGLAMMNRKGNWDYLPDDAIVFQTMKKPSSTIQKALAQEALPGHSHTTILDQDGVFRINHTPLIDAGGRKVGNMLLLRDMTSLSKSSQHDIMLASGVVFGLGGLLLWLYYLVVGRIEKRLASSQAEIKASEVRFRNLVESSSDYIWEVDAKGRYVYVSPKVTDMLGYAPAEVLGKTPFDLMPPEEAERIAAIFGKLATERQPIAALENTNLHKNGRLVVLETNGVPIIDPDGMLRGYCGVDRDISERKHTEKILQESMQRLALHVQQTPLAVIEWDTAFRVVDWNPAAENIFGHTKAEALGRHAMELILPESAKPHVAQIWESLLTGQGGFRSTNENLTKDGKTIYCEWYNTPLIDSGGRVIGVTSLAQDVTEQKLAAERLNYLAYYDDLTGLPNRVLFIDRLSHAFTVADRNERLVGVMLLDIDHFKDVNDTLGHKAGDVLLQAVGRRLQDGLRASDTVARFSGDEFAVIIAEAKHADDVVQVAQHIADNFTAPFDILGHELFVTFSMGITLYPFDDGNIDNLLRNADSAMYAAKAAGRNCYRFYAEDMTARAMEHLDLQAGLRHALDKGEFILHYQPQLDIESNRIISVEALVRWQHPEKGMISPAQFIPVAEDSGLIVPMGEWILRTACLQAKAWQEQGLPPVCMAVNLSARQFREPLFPHRVLEILNETGLDPHYLELEITESVLVEGVESVSTVLQEFKRAGIMIALDDFGTGYSSLSYLKRFPIDKLKIDQSFVRDMLENDNDASLVRAIIAMARALRLRVIAEGVETQGQFDSLHADGCDEIQGYHIARPMAAEQAADLILRYKV